MMFLIRAAFWLMILILLIPTDDKQRSEVYGTAEAAVKDVTSFCDRNPEPCAKGRDVLDVFMQKAEFGAHMLMDFINGRTGAGSDEPATSWPSTGSGDESAAAPASWETGASQDTLIPADREADWSGPDASGT
jgi:Family of unknown function (DUF5330)